MVAVLVYIVRATVCVVVVAVGLLLLLQNLVGNGRESWGQLLFYAVYTFLGTRLWPRLPGAWRRDPPTKQQLGLARAFRIVVPDGVTRGELSDLLRQAKADRGGFWFF